MKPHLLIMPFPVRLWDSITFKPPQLPSGTTLVWDTTVDQALWLKKKNLSKWYNRITEQNRLSLHFLNCIIHTRLPWKSSHMTWPEFILFHDHICRWALLGLLPERAVAATKGVAAAYKKEDLFLAQMMLYIIYISCDSAHFHSWRSRFICDVLQGKTNKAGACTLHKFLPGRVSCQRLGGRSRKVRSSRLSLTILQVQG